jgi:DNA-binding NarL/FixJ family response regulator
MSTVVPFHWNAFGELQAVVDGAIVTARAHGREEALSQLLDDHAHGVGSADAETMQRRFASLAANRAKKYRRRAAAAGQIAAHMRSRHSTDAWEPVDVQQLVDLVARELTDDELALAGCLGREFSYNEIAGEVGKPIGTVKAEISRMRRRIRGTPLGRYILTVLAA